MARWTDNKLDLGALGALNAWSGGLKTWTWYWTVRHNGADAILYHGDAFIPTAARARRAAEAWLRKARKQAGKRLEQPQKRLRVHRPSGYDPSGFDPH